MTSAPWPTAVAALQLGTRLVDAIQDEVIAAGFRDVTALHGFAFARIADGGATVAELGEHLAVSKQAAAQLVARLERAGYVVRAVHPRDRRAQLVQLTPEGLRCTVIARAAAEREVGRWREELGLRRADAFSAGLLALTAGVAPLRPPR